MHVIRNRIRLEVMFTMQQAILQTYSFYTLFNTVCTHSTNSHCKISKINRKFFNTSSKQKHLESKIKITGVLRTQLGI